MRIYPFLFVLSLLFSCDLNKSGSNDIDTAKEDARKYIESQFDFFVNNFRHFFPPNKKINPRFLQSLKRHEIKHCYQRPPNPVRFLQPHYGLIHQHRDT